MFLSDQTEFSVPAPPPSLRSFRSLTGFVALDFGEKFVRQQKIPALHRHQQVLFFPHDGREARNSVDGKNLRFLSRRRSLGRALPYIPQRAAEPWP